MMKKMKAITFLSSLFITTACVANCKSNDAASTKSTVVSALSSETPQLNKTNILTGLQTPWDLAFAADGTMLFTEKCRGLSVLKSNGQTALLFAPTDLFCEGQSGMHGIAFDPDFTTNRRIYVFMSSKLSNPKTNRVVRLVINANYTAVSNRTDIVTDLAYKNNANDWGSAGSHSGGRLRFGPDGYLYITTGDNHNGTLPQDLRRLGGKVIRVDRDGRAAPGNNTPSGGDTRIFTYGHRNVQGICFQNGKVFISEHGPNHSDEVTLISAGGNGGWDPKPNPGVSCDSGYCGYTSNNVDGSLTSMTDLKKFPNAMKPLLSLDDSQGMGPCTFLSGSQWKGWDGAMVVGIMGGLRLDVLKITEQGSLSERSTASTLPSQRVRSTAQGPDGNLYISTDSGEVWKVTPQ